MRKSVVYFLLLLVGVASPAFAQRGAVVTILHFNDVYEITPVDGGRAGGLARVAEFRAQLKERQPALLTTLAGDYLSPSAIGTAKIDGVRLDGKQMVAVLNSVGLDWATFGNHEFDIPQAAFLARLSESRFHVVSSNVTDVSGVPFPGTVTSAVVPFRTAAGTVRIGLIGLTLASNSQPWVRYAPPLESARQAIADLQGHCDAIVALTHLPLDDDRRLAEGVPELDLILGGHEHENWMIERGEHLTPIVKADANVRTVAVVTLEFPRKGARPVVSSRLQRIDATMPESVRTAAEVQKWRDAGFEAFRKDGFDPLALVTVTGTPLDGRSAVVRNGATNLTQLIADAMRHEAKTEIAIYNAGSIRIDDVLPRGAITQYDVIRVLPFGGKVMKATLTGALLSRVLEAGRANAGLGGYLQTAGLPPTIDPTAAYTVSIPHFLLSKQQDIPFLSRDTPGVSDVSEFRDIRLAVIDELKRSR